MESFGLLTIATVILSMIIAIFHIIVHSFLNKKNIDDKFNLFMYSFLGSLLGGFIGTIIGYLLAYLFYPPQSDIFLPDILHGLLMTIFISSFWLLGVLTGGIKTIKPLIKFFSRR